MIQGFFWPYWLEADGDCPSEICFWLLVLETFLDGQCLRIFSSENDLVSCCLLLTVQYAYQHSVKSRLTTNLLVSWQSLLRDCPHSVLTKEKNCIK